MIDHSPTMSYDRCALLGLNRNTACFIGARILQSAYCWRRRCISTEWM